MQHPLTSQNKDHHIKEFQLQFLSRQSSRKHMEMQQQLLQQTMQRQSSKMIQNNKKNKSSKSNSQYSNKESAKRIKVKKNLFMDETDRKQSGKAKEEEGSERSKKVSAFDEGNEQSDEYRISKKYQFSIISYFFEILIAYGLTIGIFYLIQVGNFPYFQILLVIGLTQSITPWSYTNITMVLAAVVIIANKYLFVQILTYPTILLIYFSVATFNQEYKSKTLFVLVLILVFSYGFALIPAIYDSFAITNKFAFYYVFPILMFVLRTIVSAFYALIGFSEYIFLQIPFFMMGLEYGVILTLDTGYIQYWYLMVFFTLQIINERTQFTLGILMSAVKSCNNYRKGTLEKDDNANKEKRDISILHAHASGYTCVHSFHIVCLIYIFARLPLYSTPFTSDTCYRAYIHSGLDNFNQLWYMPLCTWILASVYQLMSLVLQRKRKDILLYGFVENGKLHTVFRGVMLVIGFWMFYLGLGIGNQIFFTFNTRSGDATVSACL